MLSIGKLAAGPDAGRYYEEAVAQGREDYYAGEGEAPGRWVGSGSLRLGLSGQVMDGEVGHLLAAEHPASGGLLGAPLGEGSVAGFDLTFKAPKSVSVAFGIAGPEVTGLLRECYETVSTRSSARATSGDWIESTLETSPRPGLTERLVKDWWQAREQGADARMIALRRADVSVFALGPAGDVKAALATLAAHRPGRWSQRRQLELGGRLEVPPQRTGLAGLGLDPPDLSPALREQIADVLEAKRQRAA